MFDWFRTVLMIFYSPARGLREMRDRGALGQAAFIALLSQVAYLLVTQWLSGEKHLVFGGPRAGARPFHVAADLRGPAAGPARVSPLLLAL